MAHIQLREHCSCLPDTPVRHPHAGSSDSGGNGSRRSRLWQRKDSRHVSLRPPAWRIVREEYERIQSREQALQCIYDRMRETQLTSCCGIASAIVISAFVSLKFEYCPAVRLRMVLYVPLQWHQRAFFVLLSCLSNSLPRLSLWWSPWVTRARMVYIMHPASLASPGRYRTVFAFPALYKGGILHGVVSDACYVVSHNTPGYLSDSPRRLSGLAQRHARDAPRDSILRGTRYYYHAIDPSARCWTICDDLELYELPSGGIPPAWRECEREEPEQLFRKQYDIFKGEVKAHDKRCFVCGEQGMLEAAHIIPKVHGNWFAAHEIWQAAGDEWFGPSIDRPSNLLSLRKDIHGALDSYEWAIVPRGGKWTVQYFSTTSPSSCSRFHSRELHSFKRPVPAVYIFLRFVGNMIALAESQCSGEPEPSVPKKRRKFSSDGLAPEEMGSPSSGVGQSGSSLRNQTTTSPGQSSIGRISGRHHGRRHDVTLPVSRGKARILFQDLLATLRGGKPQLRTQKSAPQLNSSPILGETESPPSRVELNQMTTSPGPATASGIEGKRGIHIRDLSAAVRSGNSRLRKGIPWLKAPMP